MDSHAAARSVAPARPLPCIPTDTGEATSDTPSAIAAVSFRSINIGVAVGNLIATFVIVAGIRFFTGVDLCSAVWEALETPTVLATPQSAPSQSGMPQVDPRNPSFLPSTCNTFHSMTTRT